jgi:hypothetical protein
MPPAAPAAAATTNILGATNVTIVATTTTTGTGAVMVSGGVFIGPHLLVSLATAIAGALAVAGNLVALIWFGMWMGLNSKNTSLATLKTIAFVQVIPWFVVSFVSMMAGPLLLVPMMLSGGTTASSQFMAWYPLLTSLVATVLYLAKDVAFVLWARRKLYSEFRERASRAGAPARLTLPLLLPHAPLPPVIPPAQPQASQST